MNKMDEMILVSKRATVFGEGKSMFVGLETDDDFVSVITSNIGDNLEVMKRGDAEENPLYKQPIPYGIIKRGEEIFVYKRLAGAGETRLHEKTSIGVGGHMNEIEGAIYFEQMIVENLIREISEEIQIDSDEFDLQLIGLINDESNAVGVVHIGILAVIEIPAGTNVEVIEKDQLQGYFMTVDELLKPKNFDTLENWSKIALDILK